MMLFCHYCVICGAKCLHLMLVPRSSVTLKIGNEPSVNLKPSVAHLQTVSLFTQRKEQSEEWDGETETDRGASLTVIFCLSSQIPSDCFCPILLCPLRLCFSYRPSWATFRKGGQSRREWVLTAVATKWKQIRGLWNSTALWSQISCPLHLLIQDNWFFRRFNLLSGVWLVMIYRALCSPSENYPFWGIINSFLWPFIYDP